MGGATGGFGFTNGGGGIRGSPPGGGGGGTPGDKQEKNELKNYGTTRTNGTTRTK